nr:helical backbone metal receptor [Pandoraea terrae]
MFVDAVGRHHALAGHDCRIVSLVPSLTELLFALGLDDRIVGRTGFCVHPRERVANLPKVGGTKAVKLDRLRALAPTHVIVNIDENERDTVDEIAAFVPNVIVTHPCAPDDNIALYHLLGGIFGRLPEAQALSVALQHGIDTLRAAAWPQRRVLYLIWRAPWMTVSPDTYISAMLRLVEWRTMPASPAVRYPVVELDDTTLADIDLILLSTEPYRFRETHVAEIQAMTGKPVRLVDGEMISWYGSRAIAGLAYLRDFAQAPD